MLKFKNFSNIFKRTLMVSVLGLTAFTITSCSKPEESDFDFDASYLTVGNDKVTNGDVWNELKWNASSLFGDKKNEAILKAQLEDIKDTVAGADNDKRKEYTKRLKNYLIEDVHNLEYSLEDHDDEIEKLDQKTKEHNYKVYADEVYKDHKIKKADGSLLTTKEIYDNLASDNLDALAPLYELYYLDYAKELFANDKLAEEIKEKNEKDANDDDEDTIGYFSKSDIINKYRSEYLNKGDVNVIMIKFASEQEANNTLRSFGLKVKDNQFYFLNDNRNFNEFKTYYDDFDFNEAKPSEYLPLDAYYGNSIILQLYIAMYNYIYTYREPLANATVSPSTTIDNREITRSLIATYDSLEINNKADDEKRIDEVIMAPLLANEVSNKFIHYTSEEIAEIDSSLHSYIYKDLKYKELETESNPNPEWVNKESDASRYSTTPKSIGDSYYMVFKESQALNDNDKLNYDDEWKQVKDDDLFESLTAEKNKTIYDGVIEELTNEKLTKSYIDEKVSAEIKDVKISIYDKNIEITYAVTDADYSKTLSKAPSINTLAVFEYKDNKVSLDLTNEEGTGAWDILEYRTGVFVASKLMSDIKIKQTDEYNDIKKEDIDNYYLSIEYILASFANDALAQQGYPASIGKYNFLMLYYHTADIDEIVNNVFKVAKASNELLIDYSDEKILTDIFSTYTNAAYDNFFSLTTKNLQVFIDTDEDGKADEGFDYQAKVKSGVYAGKTYEYVAKELIKDIYKLLENSNEAYAAALDGIVTKYNQSSRFNPKEGDRFEEENYDPIGSEWLFSKYKKLGFAIAAPELKVTNTSTEVDIKIRQKLKNLHDTEKFADRKYLSSFLEDVNNENAILNVNDSYNYYVVTGIDRRTSAKYEAYNDPKKVFENIHIMYNNELQTIENIYNENDRLSNNQIKAYIIEKLAYETSNLLPTEISQSLTNYCDPVLTRFLDTTTQAEIVYKYVGNNDAYVFGNAENAERFNALREINQKVADNYISADEDAAFNNFHGWWETIANLELKGGNK